MSADTFTVVRLQKVKALVRRLAERDGINESTLVKQLLEVLLRTQTLSNAVQTLGEPAQPSTPRPLHLPWPI